VASKQLPPDLANEDPQRAMSNLVEALTAPFLSIWKHRSILLRTTYGEIRNAYAGSLLGSSWVLIGQILMLAIYAVTYVVILRIRPADMTVYEYILYVFCGLTSFLPFAASLSAGTLSLVSNRAVLLNTIFPAELIPFRSVLVASITMPVGTLILFASDYFLSEFTWTSLLVPVVMLLQTLFIAGIVWVFSLAALVFRDIQHMIYYITMMLMIISPIAYTPTMIPAGLSMIIYFNPLSYYIISFQSLIMLNRLPSWDIIAVMLIASFTSFSLGFMMVRRAKGAFYDYA
jgi:lipopolysaccharide transport system permease protein